MKTSRNFVRVVQYFSDEKLAEFKNMPVKAKLRWLESAHKFLYKVYLSSGAKEPYNPQSWPYSKTS